MAFSPAMPGKLHPRPWRAARGGLAYDITMDLCIPEEGTSLPSGLTAEETAWWIVALLRLAYFPFLNVPVLSDQSFSTAGASEIEPNLRPFETEHRIFRAPDDTASTVSQDHLTWLRSAWSNSANLIKNSSKFETALRAVDACSVGGRTSASLLAVWGALEQLFSPSSSELRFRVAANIAAYLEPMGESRIAQFRRAMNLYNQRSIAAHTAADVDQRYLLESFVIARNALMKMIDEDRVPSQSDLEDMLFGVIATSEKWSYESMNRREGKAQA